MIEMKSTNGYKFYISECDYEEVSKYKWFAKKHHSTFYLHNTKSDEMLHRFIMKTPKGMVTDHIDRNGLNNTRENLRICTVSENAVNTDRKRKHKNNYKGVAFDKGFGWRVYFSWHGERYDFRYFFTEEDACIFYNRKVKEIQGEFANLIPIYDDGRIIKTKGEVRRENKTSKYKYVYYVKNKKIWKAYLKDSFLKYFKNEDDAGEYVKKQLSGDDL